MIFVPYMYGNAKLPMVTIYFRNWIPSQQVDHLMRPTLDDPVTFVTSSALPIVARPGQSL